MHGDWLPWLEQEFGWSEQSARRYMAVAEQFKSLTVSDLEAINSITQRALYFLAGPSTPEDVRQEAVDAAQRGTA